MPFFYFEPKVLAHVRKDLNRHARACAGHPRLECRFKGSISLRTIFPKGQRVAEREGFEPPIRLPVCRISSAVHSTTLPPLREAKNFQVGPRYLAVEGHVNKGHGKTAQAGCSRLAPRRRCAYSSRPSLRSSE